jgi:aspartate kinase
MARIVMKFGGTSVADIARIRKVAERVKAQVDEGDEVAVTVSAMAGETDQLVGKVDQIGQLYDLREYDVVVSSGEQVSVGLLAIALQDLGVPARSWLGWQIPIRTDSAHGNARIEQIEVAEIVRRFAEGQVAVVAGFQGLDAQSRITTLGRGGSDTSAVALAAALGADRCDIYTDVDGVYTSDPRIVTRARKLERVTYEEMLEMASQGAKVLQTRSVEMAMKHRVPVQVRSSFQDGPGTLVVDEDEIVEQAVVSGIAYSRDEAKITLVKVPRTYPPRATEPTSPLPWARPTSNGPFRSLRKNARIWGMPISLPMPTWSRFRSSASGCVATRESLSRCSTHLPTRASTSRSYRPRRSR